MAEKLKAPFPWFGGKSSVADAIWKRLGQVQNYVEPFAGTLAVLLCNPDPPKTETVNDKDCFIANVWRAIQADPEATAAHCDWPVNEADLSARHQWLVNQAEFRERMKTDPDYFDAKIAGWWLWGCCSWIGSGWCRNAGRGVNRKLPHLGDAGRGVNRKLPHLGDAGRGVRLLEYFDALAARLRGVRVACGEWGRVLGPSVTTKHGLTAVLLDPPYSLEDREDLYAVETDAADDVRQWAIDNGSNRDLRIALCGYDYFEMPVDWTPHRWKAKGGYGSQGEGRGRDNAEREVVWFSPHCEQPPSLFPE